MPDTFLCDSVSLDASPPDTVERDASGVPVAWRLLAPGENTLNKAGLPLVIDLTPERLKQALGYYAEKGEKIPIDSSHYLSDLADAHDIAESEVERMIPAGVAAMGYGELEEREGALWITRVDWKAAAGKDNQGGGGGQGFIIVEQSGKVHRVCALLQRPEIS